MTGSPVLVLGNGAARPKRTWGYKDLLTIDYRDTAKGNVAINLSLPDFIRGVFHIPDRTLDLLEIAAYVYAADRLTYRGPRDALEYHAWARTFEFRIRVRDYAFWTNSDAAERLAVALQFLTGDREYRFKFEGGHYTPATSLFDRQGFSLEPQPESSVLLFSGGLDSLSGALELLSAGAPQLCLVSHRASPGIVRTQNSIVQALNAKPQFRGRIRHYTFQLNLSRIKAAEESQRSRAFLYTVIAFAISQALGKDEVLVYENGVTSINFSRREDAMLARTSRTTHPKTLSLLADAYTSIAGRPIRIRDPYIWTTKAEVFTRLRMNGGIDLIPSAVSCGHTRQRRETATHCGTCFQCVDRRLAAFAAGCDDADDAGIYANNFITESVSGEAKTTLVDYIRQAMEFTTGNVDHFYTTRMNELLDLVDYVPDVDGDEMAAVDRIFELCKRHGRAVECAIRKVRDQYDRPFERLAPDSLLTIVADREYLNDPVHRLVRDVASRLEHAIPKMFAKGRRPKDENDLNQKTSALLDSYRTDLVSEHPEVSFACARVIPDHAFAETDLLIEAKYIRAGTSPSKASEGIAGDLTKYPPRKHILFLVYDPDQSIADLRRFIDDIESRGRCTVRVLR